MKIIDLTPEHEALYFSCLEPWSDEMKDRGDDKERWYARYRDRGLFVKLAQDDDGAVVGMIQALPIEESWIEGEDLDVVLCTWVHGHDEGVGNRQGRGAGTLLLESVEDNARARGRKGVAAWGLGIPVWMKASWYRKHGYRRVDRDGMAVLLLKAFDPAAVEPRWLRRQRTPPPASDGPVEVTCFVNGWCPVMSISATRAERVCSRYSDDVVTFTTVVTTDPDVRRDWGIVDGLYVGDRSMRTGPPPSEERIGKRIDRAVRGPWWRRRAVETDTEAVSTDPETR